jgi:hypothetical protein
MKMRKRANSGQILLIAAFIMASLLVSAQLYILEVGKTSGEVESDSLSDFISSIQFGSRNVVLGSLANVSNGGLSNTLELNLREWAAFIANQYLYGKSILYYTLRDTAPYSSGIWLDWSLNGYGASSAYVNFTHRLSGLEASVDHSYLMNITTTLLIASTNRRLSENARQVNVTINVLNEAEPALAKRITLYYRVSNSWLIPDMANNYTLLDYGNGTYLASFVATFPTESVEVSAHIVDYRDICVQANTTSTEI